MADPVLALPDVNVLVALTNAEHDHHRRAHAWWGGVERWATTPITESSFMRLMLNPVVTGAAFSFAQVLAVLRGLKAQPGYVWLPDESSLEEAAIEPAGLRGYAQVTDFHLVNLAARSGAVLVTLDARLPRALTTSDRAHCLLI